MKVPKGFVRVVFLSYARGCGYTAGEKAPAAALNCVLRAGHTAQEKTDTLKRLWSTFQQLTGVATEQLAISLQEIPASNAMEMGRIMQPETAGSGSAHRSVTKSTLSSNPRQKPSLTNSFLRVACVSIENIGDKCVSARAEALPWIQNCIIGGYGNELSNLGLEEFVNKKLVLVPKAAE